jgi:hypothetical protein
MQESDEIELVFLGKSGRCSTVSLKKRQQIVYTSLEGPGNRSFYEDLQ